MVPPPLTTWRDRLRALPVIDGDLPAHGLEDVADPMPAIGRWLSEAIDAGIPAPHVAHLATADAGGRPSGRALIVKDLGPDAIWFSSSAVSRKGRELADNPRAAITLVWIPLGRQLRLEGPVDAPSRETSEADFRARSPVARREMLAGAQSSPRGADAEERIARAGELLDRDPDAVDPQWTAYRLRPDAVEFWASRPGDSALRIRFSRADPDGSWMKERLWT